MNSRRPHGLRAPGPPNLNISLAGTGLCSSRTGRLMTGLGSKWPSGGRISFRMRSMRTALFSADLPSRFLGEALGCAP
jgi:hypothetical protein